MSSRTIFLGRLFGLYCLLAGISMIIRKQSIIETVTALVHNAPLMFFIGVATLFGGLAMVLAHNVWSGSGLAVVVTLLGWTTLAKGLLFLFLPPPPKRISSSSRCTTRNCSTSICPFRCLPASI